MNCSPQPGVGDDPAGGGVDLLARRADDGGRHRGLLRLEEHGVRLGHLVGRLAQVHAPRDVGAVADAVLAEHGAAEVAEDDLALADHAVARLVVGAGGVGARRDDGEVHTVVALGAQAAAELGRHLRLGATDELDVARLELGGHTIGGRAGPPQGFDLGGVLPGAQRPHHLAPPGEHGGRQRVLQVDHEPRPRAITDGDAVHPADQLGDDGHRVVGLVPGAEREHVGALHDARRLEPGHHQGGVAVGGEHEHGEPLERHRLVPGEVREVGPHRQEHGIDTELRQAGSRPGHARVRSGDMPPTWLPSPRWRVTDGARGDRPRSSSGASTGRPANTVQVSMP